MRCQRTSLSNPRLWSLNLSQRIQNGCQFRCFGKHSNEAITRAKIDPTGFSQKRSCYFFLIGINAPIGFWFVVHNTNGKSISNLFRIGYNLPAILRKFLFRYLTSNLFNSQHIVLGSVFHRCVINASAPIVKAVWQLLGKVFR